MLPDMGTLVYNGFDFGAGGGGVNTAMSFRPLTDDAMLTTKAAEFSFSVKSYVYSPAPGAETTDDRLDEVYELLTATGKQLEFYGKGGGVIQCNGAGGNADWDINAGPHPQVSNWRLLGGGNAVAFDWSCKVALARCPDRTLVGLSMLNHSVNWSVSNGGWTVRRVTILIEVAQSVRNRRVHASADEYYTKVLPPRLPGFSRQIDRDLSLNKAREVITVVDTETPFGLPDGVDVCNLRWRIKNSKRGFGLWNWSLGGTVEPIASESGVTAWDRFWLVLQSRLNHIDSTAQRVRENAGGVGGGGRGPAGPNPFQPGGPGGPNPFDPVEFFGIQTGGLARAGGQLARQGGGGVGAVAGGGGGAAATPPAQSAGRTHVIFELEIDEDVFGKSHSFRCGGLLLKSNLARILKDSGLWQPIPGVSGSRWVGTLPGPRGRAGLRHEAGQEVVIDLCRRQQPQPLKPDGGPRTSPGDFGATAGGSALAGGFGATTGLSGKGGGGGPGTSTAGGGTGTGTGRGFPPGTGTGVGWAFPPGEGTNTGRGGGPGTGTGTGTGRGPRDGDGYVSMRPRLEYERETPRARHQPIGVDDRQKRRAPNVIQQVSAQPATRVWLTGDAIRLYAPPDIPELVKVGGVEAHERRLWFSVEEIANYGGVPVYHAAWDVEYWLEEEAPRVPILGNLAAGP